MIISECNQVDGQLDGKDFKEMLCGKDKIKRNQMHHRLLMP